MGEMYSASSVALGMDASYLQEYRDRYDRVCKRLLSEKIILAWILHDCLDEFSEVDPQEIAETLIEGEPEIGTVALHAGEGISPRITGLQTEDSSVDEGTVWFDIRFKALLPTTSESVAMFVNIEAQNDFYPGYSLLQRATYYCARMISSQYGRTFVHSHCEHLQKVCSIWICPNPPARFRNTITRYAMAEQQIVGRATAPKNEYDLQEIVLVCPDGDRQQPGDGILRLLGTLIASEQDLATRKTVIEGEFGIPMYERLSDEVDEIVNLSKGVMEKGMERGYEKGLEQGFAQGQELGIRKGIEQGIERGIERGIQQGIEQGIQQGKTRQTKLIALLADELAKADRSDELVQALHDEALLARLLEEYGIEQ